MTALARIRVHVLLALLLISFAVFFTPTFPVQVHKTKEWSCSPAGTCREYENYTELDPAILVGSSGFSWSTRTTLTDGENRYRYDASPSIMAIHLLSTAIILAALILKAGDKRDKWRLDLRRRYWRVFLWGIGFYFLVLSVFWAWGYMIFYGVNESVAIVDPFLMSSMCTFLLSGLGLAMMMLSVRSRAIWPVPSKD